MPSEEIAIDVQNVTKLYKLYKSPADRFKESMGLSKKIRYQELYALKDVSFQVHKGECVGIIGTNGSGKSTILKIITGVLNPTGGGVSINGRISALLELGAGFNPEYTGLENIYLNGTMMGFQHSEIDARVDDIIKFADIGEFIHQPVKTYSSGMFVRLAFAVAINIDPEILIIDEALSVGDVFFQAKCYRKFDEFKKAGKTILFVSHDLGAVGNYCDRVVLLNKGVKQSEGQSREIIDEYKQLLVKSNDEKQKQRKEDKTQHSEEENHELTGILERNPNTLEYGEGGAKIQKIRILDEHGNETSTVEKRQTFTIRMTVKFDQDIEEPIFAYSFKNARGTEITGTNTMYEKTPIKGVKAGQTVTVDFKQVMNLQGSDYLLSLGCTGYVDGNLKVFHRLYDVISITVMSPQNTVGLYDMFSDITFEID